MRLWSIHPNHLDAKGLVALWREALLAQKVLRGRTVGYRNHPQLSRFRDSRRPVAAIGAYLDGVLKEARARGYQFDGTKIAERGSRLRLTVTRGQLNFERRHLEAKLAVRDPARLASLRRGRTLEAHPLFTIVDGPKAPWEKGALGF